MRQFQQHWKLEVLIKNVSDKKETTRESLAWRQNHKAVWVNKVRDFHLHRLTEAQEHPSVSGKLLDGESKHIVLPFGPTSVFNASLPNIPRE